MSTRNRGDEYRSTMVCIDAYDERVLKGRFYNPFWAEGVEFHNLMQFLLKMEQLLDAMDYPQSFSSVRTFSRPQVAIPDRAPVTHPAGGKQGTFEIRLLFRQNTSWQGSISWLEGKREEPFRSVLELIVLMDSALSISGG